MNYGLSTFFMQISKPFCNVKYNLLSCLPINKKKILRLLGCRIVRTQITIEYVYFVVGTERKQPGFHPKKEENKQDVSVFAIRKS